MDVVRERKLIDDAYNLSFKKNDEVKKTLESGAYLHEEIILLEKYLQKFKKLSSDIKKERGNNV